MKWIALIIIFSSCTASRFTPEQQQQVRFVRATADTLVFIKGNDTVFMLDNSTSRKHLTTGDRYTISYDSSSYKIIDGKKYFRSTLKRNQ